MITLHIQADTAAEFFRDLAGIGGKQTLAGINTETLIDELRTRMADKGHVVNIDPIGEAAAGDAAATPAAPRRGRPPLTPEEKAARAAKAAEPEAAEPTKAAEPKAAANINANVSRDDVIAALNTFSAARGGQTAGRQKMQEVCGVTRLQDIKPEDYGKLVDALRAA
jgi:membrane protein involved in colicin uptake